MQWNKSQSVFYQQRKAAIKITPAFINWTPTWTNSKKKEPRERKNASDDSLKETSEIFFKSKFGKKIMQKLKYGECVIVYYNFELWKTEYC